MNRFNFLKYVQHFDALDTNQKEEKKKETKNIQFTTFRNTATLRKISTTQVKRK